MKQLSFRARRHSDFIYAETPNTALSKADSKSTSKLNEDPHGSKAKQLQRSSQSKELVSPKFKVLPTDIRGAETAKKAHQEPILQSGYVGFCKPPRSPTAQADNFQALLEQVAEIREDFSKMMNLIKEIETRQALLEAEFRTLRSVATVVREPQERKNSKTSDHSTNIGPTAVAEHQLCEGVKTY